jgi:2-(3-amino-3-carboxypropyl)histidine synthase
MKDFDLEEERVKQAILKLGAKRVLIQVPEGLKPEALRLAEIIEKTGALPIISADPCYGACDLATSAAEELSVDLLVHYGHSKMVSSEEVSTLYIEARASAEIDDAVRKALYLLTPYHKIGLATTVQHVEKLEALARSESLKRLLELL